MELIQIMISIVLALGDAPAYIDARPNMQCKMMVAEQRQGEIEIQVGRCERRVGTVMTMNGSGASTYVEIDLIAIVSTGSP